MQHDWRRLAGLAMSRLGWSPEIFWAATPQDLLMALGGTTKPGAAPMRRQEFVALMARFPEIRLDPPSARTR